MENSQAYEAARIKCNEATREFFKSQVAYRARSIGDVEFLAAKALHNAAQAEFDDALLAELGYQRA